MRDLSLLLCTISIIAGFISCDNVKSNGGQSSRLPPGQRSGSEVVEIYDQPEQPVRAAKPVRTEKSRIESDSSLVETMFDAYGNKIESRYFKNNPVLKMIVVRTGADGQTEAIIYGQNGDIKAAPPEIIGGIMKAPAKEIARAAEIAEGTIQNEIPAMLAAQKPPPEIAPLTLSENLSTPAQTPLIKTENLIETEMLSDQIIKPDKKQTNKNKINDEDVKPYDIPQN